MSKILKYNKLSNYLIILLYIIFSYILFFDKSLLIGSKIESFIFYFFIFYILFFLNSSKLFSIKYIGDKDKFLNKEDRIKLLSSNYPLFLLFGFFSLLILLIYIFLKNQLFIYSVLSLVFFLFINILLFLYIFKRKLIISKLKRINFKNNKLRLLYYIFLFLVLFYLFYQLLIN